MPNTHANEFIPPRKIAVATDFSVTSGLAIRWAITWAHQCNAHLSIVHVTPSSEYHGPSALRNAVRKEVREEIERQLDCYVNRLRGIPHEFVCLEGRLEEAIHNFVQEAEIDLLILGSLGRKGIRKALLGSAAEAILHAVDCPVMTVGIDSANYSKPADGIHRILFPTDFSPDSLSASRFAVTLANAHAAQLLVLHVASPAEKREPDEPEPKKHHLKALERLLDEAPDLKASPKFLYSEGNPVEAILATARDQVIDLIILGVRNQKRLELDGAKPSLSYEIVARSHCPVITLHPFDKHADEDLSRKHLARLTSQPTVTVH